MRWAIFFLAVSWLRYTADSQGKRAVAVFTAC